MKLSPDIKYAFDFDGTLVNCREKQLFLYCEALKKYGFYDFKPSCFWMMKTSGISTYDCLKFQCIDDKIIELAMQYWYENIENLEYQFLDKPTDLLVSEVQFLAEPTIITARRIRSNIHLQIRNLKTYLHKPKLYIVDHSSAISQKSKILIKNNIEIFIGDSEVDFYAAKLANVEFRFVEGGQRTLSFIQSLS